MEERQKRRIEAVRREMMAAGIPQMIVSDSAALWYLTGETIHPGERLTVLVIQEESVFWLRNRLFPLYHRTSDIGDMSFADGEDGVALLAKQLGGGLCGIDQTWAAG